MIEKYNILSAQIKVIVKEILLSVMHQVQIADVDEELIVWDLEKRRRIRDTDQKGSKSNEKM